MNSKIKHQYDALLALRSLTDRTTPVTADGAGGGLVDLHLLTAGRGDLKNLHGQTPFDVIIHVDSVDTASGTETYVLKLQTVDANGANPTDVPGGTLTIAAGLVGEPIVLKLDLATVRLVDADAAKLRIFADVGGATPAISYYAFAAPNSKA
jgi:hypothetical protein